MDKNELLALLETLSGDIVLGEPGDLPAMTGIHTLLEQVAAGCATGESAFLKQVSVACIKLMESVILSDVEDPAVALGAVGQTVGILRGIVGEGRREEDAGLPELIASLVPARPVGGAVSTLAKTPAAPRAADKHVVPPQVLPEDMELVGDFIAEAREHMDQVDVQLLQLEADPGDAGALNAVFRAFHTIKGTGGAIGLAYLQAVAHVAEDLLVKARDGELVLEGSKIDVVFETNDCLRQLVDRLEEALSTGELRPVEIDLPALITRIKGLHERDVVVEGVPQRLGEILLDENAISPEDLEAALAEQKAPGSRKQLGELLVQNNTIGRNHRDEALRIQREESPGDKIGDILVTMGVLSTDEQEAILRRQSDPAMQEEPLGQMLVRTGRAKAKDVVGALRKQEQTKLKEALKVDSDRLNQLIDMLGELVIAQTMVSESPEIKSIKAELFSGRINRLNKITRDLQEAGMSLRMVPINGVFQKMACLVRDLAKKSGRKVTFTTKGNETELDKTVVDRIADPLVHMVRNAVDHGLEPNEDDRIKAGKPAEGNVELRAFHKSGAIYIEIEDDGRGLNRERILDKAREKGLLREGETPADSEIWNLIFHPGFSTAATVTDVSGRGVGMDVVKQNIQGLRGNVEIFSEAGKGTKFSIRLPLTLAIIDGMIVRVGIERFVVPALSVLRSVQTSLSTITKVVGGRDYIRFLDEHVPLIGLGREFGISDHDRPPERQVAVIVEEHGRKAGFLIDELLGQQQVVIKSLGDRLPENTGIAGGVIMSDGQVGLILDVASLVKRANEASAA